MRIFIENEKTEETVEYMGDCIRLVQVAMNNGVVLTERQAHHLWSEYSDLYCATWLMMNDMDDTEIWRNLENQISKLGRLVGEE